MKKGEFVRTYINGQEIRVRLEPGPNKFAVVEIEGHTIETEVPNLTLQMLRNMVPKQKGEGKPKRKAKPKKKSKAKAQGKAKAKSKAKESDSTAAAAPYTGLYGDGEELEWAGNVENLKDESADGEESQEEDEDDEEKESEDEEAEEEADFVDTEKDKSAEPEKLESAGTKKDKSAGAEKDKSAGAKKDKSAGAEDESADHVDKTYRKEWYAKQLQYGVKQRFGARKQICSVGLYNNSSLSQATKGKIADELIDMLQKGLPEESAKTFVNAKLNAAAKQKQKNK